MYRFNSTFRSTPSRLKRSEFRRVPGTARLKAGRKTNEWANCRARLKRKFAAMGITTCELGYSGCWRDNALSIAHGKKRRKLVGNELETLTILACCPCHNQIEVLPPEEMLAIVRRVIAGRG